MGTCDVNTGNFILFNEKLSKNNLAIAAVSSASIPFIFPH